VGNLANQLQIIATNAVLVVVAQNTISLNVEENVVGGIKEMGAIVVKVLRYNLEKHDKSSLENHNIRRTLTRTNSSETNCNHCLWYIWYSHSGEEIVSTKRRLIFSNS